jgi:GTP-binding protein
VIDAQEDVRARFEAIDRELAAYGAGLGERPQIVVLNKVDLVGEPPVFDVDDARVLGTVSTSAATGWGIDELKRMLFALLPERAPALPEQAELADFLVYRPRPPRQRRFRIFRTPGGYRVRGEASEEELRAAGVKPDAVVEFERE